MLAPAETDDRPLHRFGDAAPGHAITALRIARREITEKLSSTWFAGIVTLTFLVAYAYGSMFLRTFETESVLVSRDPLLLLNAGLAGALGLVLGLRLSASIAWEREHRTLDVLLVGPVVWPILIAAKFMSELSILVLIACAYIFYLLAAQPMGAGVVGPAEAADAFLMLVLALPFLGLGLAVSSFSRTVRSATIVYFIVVLLFAAFDAGYEILVAIPPENLSLVALYGRVLSEAVAPVVKFVSPTSALASGARMFASGFDGMTSVIAHAIGLSLALVASAIAMGRGRESRR